MLSYFLSYRNFIRLYINFTYMASFVENFRSKVTFYAVEFWHFVRSIVFWKSFGGIAAMIAALFVCIFWLMTCYTNHGSSFQVDKYVGMRTKEAISKAENRSFNVEISDSIYRQGVPPGMVIDQSPKPFSKVKENRTVYLTVTRYTADMVTLPDIYGNDDFHQYSRKVATIGITCRIVSRRLDTKLSDETILAVMYKGQDITEKLAKGFKLEMGSTLDFVVSQTTNDQRTVPDLVCSTVDAAEFMLSTSNLTVGGVEGSVRDRASAFIWKQDPEAGTPVEIGTTVTLYITQEKPEACPDDNSQSEEAPNK